MRAITLLLLALVLVAGADTVTFQPDGAVGKDASVFDNTPNSNYGASPTLAWGYGSNQSETYIAFNELNDSQYQGATVNSAILSLYVYSMGGDVTDIFYVKPVGSTWDESTITWNNRPTLFSASISQNYPPGTGWLSVNITAWVQNWLDGAWTNNGLFFYNSTGSTTNDYMNVRSSDYTADSSLRPKLVLDYTPSAIEEATWGEIKAAF